MRTERNWRIDSMNNAPGAQMHRASHKFYNYINQSFAPIVKSIFSSRWDGRAVTEIQVLMR